MSTLYESLLEALPHDRRERVAGKLYRQACVGGLGHRFADRSSEPAMACEKCVRRAIEAAFTKAKVRP